MQARPPNHGFHETRDTRHGFAWRAARGALWAGARGFHETRTRNTNHGFFSKHGLYAFREPTASLPTISHHFPRFPGISRPPHPPSADQVSTRRPPFLVSRPGLPPPPGRCFPARCGAAWGGYGAAWAAWSAPSRCPRTVRTGNSAFRVFTKHETRDPAIARRAARGALWAGANSEVFTKHESRDTNHGLFPACFDRRVVRYAGYCMPRSEKFRV